MLTFICPRVGFSDVSPEEFAKLRIINGFERYQDFVLTCMSEVTLSDLLEAYNNNILLPRWIPNGIKLVKIYYVKKTALLIYCNRDLNPPRDNLFLDSNFTIQIYPSTPVIPKNPKEPKYIKLTENMYAHIIEGKLYTNYTIRYEGKVIAQGIVDIPSPTVITFYYRGFAYTIRGYLDKETMIKIAKSMLQNT